MLLFIRVPRCSRGAFMNSLKLTQPRMLWLDQRLAPCTARRRINSANTIQETSFFSNSLPGKNMSVIACGSCRALHAPAGRTRTISHTHAASASSSSASSPAESVKAPTVQASAVPLEDVKRILKLAQSERWRLAGTVFYLFTFCLFYDVMLNWSFLCSPPSCSGLPDRIQCSHHVSSFFLGQSH